MKVTHPSTNRSGRRATSLILRTTSSRRHAVNHESIYLSVRPRMSPCVIKPYTSVFSFLRRLSTWRCPHLLLHDVVSEALRPPAAVDRYLLPAGRSAENPQTCASVDRWDRQTNKRTDGRTDAQPLYKPCCAYSVNNSLSSRPFPATYRPVGKMKWGVFFCKEMKWGGVFFVKNGPFPTKWNKTDAGLYLFYILLIWGCVRTQHTPCLRA